MLAVILVSFIILCAQIPLTSKNSKQTEKSESTPLIFIEAHDKNSKPLYDVAVFYDQKRTNNVEISRTRKTPVI